MLRLHDPRTGGAETLPGGRVLRVHLLDGAGLRTLIVVDVMRRAAGRTGRHVRITGPANLVDRDWSEYAEYNIQPFEAVAEGAPDLYVSGEHDPQLDGFQVIEALRQEFSLPVEILNPFQRIAPPASGPTAELIEKNAGQLAVAVGLALRSFEQ